MRLIAIAVACALAACTPTPASIASPSPSRIASPTGTPFPLTTAYKTIDPQPLPRGTDKLPTLESDPRFAGLTISLSADAPRGTVGESTTFVVARPTVDRTYLTRVTSAFGVSGAGTLEVSPDGTAPWRVWLGPKTLAVNERTGDVLFFDPLAKDDPGAVPPARDLAAAHVALVTKLSPEVDFKGVMLMSFLGGDATASAERVIDGSWLPDGARVTSVAFPEYHTLDGSYGTRIYGTDDVALLTPAARPIEVVHRPLVSVALGAVYPMTLYGDAVRELLAAPARYLHLLSVAPTEAVTLHVDMSRVAVGHAWAGGQRGDLTHLGAMLVPVWGFYAEGATRSGAPVRALFLVDAVTPEFRAAPASATRNLTADELLRRQLSVSVGSHDPNLLSAEGALQDVLAGFACTAGRYTISKSDADTAVASVTCPNGTKLDLTMRRAFPGLDGSIWYLSEARK